MDSKNHHDLIIEQLGEAIIRNPITTNININYIKDSDRVLENMELKNLIAQKDALASFEYAGPRKLIYFKPENTRAAIVTCGGLCPGINAVIRGIVREIRIQYQVEQIYGIKYGYQGFQDPINMIPLTANIVENIHNRGGTILGSSRGTPSTALIVDQLVKKQINILFTIGGDGTMRGALAIADEIKKRNLKIGIIGIPKTIDNDIPYVRRSFGFETAVDVAENVILSAHEEAQGHQNGVGLVKLMGRNTGYIAATATLCTGHVNICLIPEIPFDLQGKHNLFQQIENNFNRIGHCLIVVAEGAGQRHLQHLIKNDQDVQKDSSGNQKLQDIGLFLKQAIQYHFAQKNIPMTLKYIDPSYIIRSNPANSFDKVFCLRLAQNAVHAAMAGKTALLIGYWHGMMTHVPIKAISNKTKKVNPKGTLWFNVLEDTGQNFHR